MLRQSRSWFFSHSRDVLRKALLAAMVLCALMVALVVSVSVQHVCWNGILHMQLKVKNFEAVHK